MRVRRPPCRWRPDRRRAAPVQSASRPCRRPRRRRRGRCRARAESGRALEAEQAPAVAGRAPGVDRVHRGGLHPHEHLAGLRSGRLARCALAVAAAWPARCRPVHVAWVVLEWAPRRVGRHGGVALRASRRPSACSSIASTCSIGPSAMHATVGADDDDPAERHTARQQCLVERLQPLVGGGQMLRLRALAPLPHLAARRCQRCTRSAQRYSAGSTPTPISAQCRPSASSLSTGALPVAERTQPCGSVEPARSRSCRCRARTGPSSKVFFGLTFRSSNSARPAGSSRIARIRPCTANAAARLLRHHQRPRKRARRMIFLACGRRSAS